MLWPKLFLKPCVDLFNLHDERLHLAGIICALVVSEVLCVNEATNGQMAGLGKNISVQSPTQLASKSSRVQHNENLQRLRCLGSD